MTADPKTIAPDEFAISGLAIMEQKKITSLIVVDGDRRLRGIVHLHDLWGTEMVQGQLSSDAIWNCRSLSLHGMKND